MLEASVLEWGWFGQLLQCTAKSTKSTAFQQESKRQACLYAAKGKMKHTRYRKLGISSFKKSIWRFNSSFVSAYTFNSTQLICCVSKCKHVHQSEAVQTENKQVSQFLLKNNRSLEEYFPHFKLFPKSWKHCHQIPNIVESLIDQYNRNKSSCSLLVLR